MNYSLEVKERLLSLISEMNTYHWLFTKHPETDFSRVKKWSFEETIKFILFMEGKSIKDELLEYFDFDNHTPSNSSFNQRRAQILPEAFEFLFKEFSNIFTDNTSCYDGFRLIACDGTDLCIARNCNDKSTYIQSSENSQGYNMLHFTVLYDLCSRTYIDGIIQPKKDEHETGALWTMSDRYRGSENTIFIADRNFENYNAFAHIQERGMYYLIRVKDIDSNGITSTLDFSTTPSFDEWKTVTLTRKQTKEIKQNPQKYRLVMKKTTFDYLDSHDNLFYDMKMRIVRFPISESTYECIITNLPQEVFPSEKIKELYHMRWGIETSFRELKYAIGLTRFHSKKIDYIKQEIWSRLLLYNFCEIITTKVVVHKRKNQKYNYQLNYTRAIRICCYFVSLKKEKIPPDVEYLIGRELLPIRPGRKDPRKVKTQAAISFLYRAA